MFKRGANIITIIYTVSLYCIVTHALYPFSTLQYRQQFKDEILSKQSSVNEDQPDATTTVATHATASTSLDNHNDHLLPHLPSTESTSSSPPRTRRNNFRRHIDTLLARNLDSVLLKSLEENSMWRSSESVIKENGVASEHGDMCASIEELDKEGVGHECIGDNAGFIDSMVVPNGVLDDSSSLPDLNCTVALERTEPVDIHVEPPPPVEQRNQSNCIIQKQNSICEQEPESLCTDIKSPLITFNRVQSESSIERRYSSVDIPGISIVSETDDGKTGSEYSLLPNGMVVRAVPDIKLLSYHGSEYKGSKGRLGRCSKSPNKSKVKLNNNPCMQINCGSAHQDRLSSSNPHVGNAIDPVDPPSILGDVESTESNFGGSFPGRENHRKMKPVGAQKFSKDELYMMWKVSERELKKQLESALTKNEELEKELTVLKMQQR